MKKNINLDTFHSDGADHDAGYGHTGKGPGQSY